MSWEHTYTNTKDPLHTPPLICSVHSLKSLHIHHAGWYSGEISLLFFHMSRYSLGEQRKIQVFFKLNSCIVAGCVLSVIALRWKHSWWQLEQRPWNEGNERENVIKSYRLPNGYWIFRRNVKWSSDSEWYGHLFPSLNREHACMSMGSEGNCRIVWGSVYVTLISKGY